MDRSHVHDSSCDAAESKSVASGQTALGVGPNDLLNCWSALDRDKRRKQELSVLCPELKAGLYWLAALRKYTLSLLVS